MTSENVLSVVIPPHVFVVSVIARSVMSANRMGYVQCVEQIFLWKSNHTKRLLDNLSSSLTLCQVWYTKDVREQFFMHTPQHDERPAGEAARVFTQRLNLFLQCAYIVCFCILIFLAFPSRFTNSPPLDYSKEPAMYWFYFFALTFGYLCGCLTPYLSAWLHRRSIRRRLKRAQEEDEAMNEGYTLTVLRAGDPYEGERDDYADEEA